MRLPMPLVVRGDARSLPLRDGSVDLIVTSPPYLGLRSYTDDGGHYSAQIGAEATPQEYLNALIACTCEMMRVLKPSGSIWVNLGDKYSGYNNGSGKGRSLTLGGVALRPACAITRGILIAMVYRLSRSCYCRTGMRFVAWTSLG